MQPPSMNLLPWKLHLPMENTSIVMDLKWTQERRKGRMAVPKVRKKRAKELEIFYREGEVTSVHQKSPLIQEIVTKKMVKAMRYCFLQLRNSTSLKPLK